MRRQQIGVQGGAERVPVEKRPACRPDGFHRRLNGRLQLGDGECVQLMRIGGRDAELHQHGLRQPQGAFFLAHPDHRATLHDGAVEQPHRHRHRQQGADFRPAAGLTKDRHVAGIAAKR